LGPPAAAPNGSRFLFVATEIETVLDDDVRRAVSLIDLAEGLRVQVADLSQVLRGES
jgi:hypothetical protein